MLAGRRAFVGATTIDVLMGALKDDPQPLSTLNRQVPEPLERIVRRCLEKEPNARFQSTRDLAFALEALTSSLQTDSGYWPRAMLSYKTNR